MSHERLAEWARDNADEVARRLADERPELAAKLLRQLEAEDGSDDETWQRHFEETFGFKPNGEEPARDDAEDTPADETYRADFRARYGFEPL